uniref:Uncharacterized protein n=1 Tax=Octopus bimaculoides TaxID=37653 RepID=A0A0L8HQZ1_OCTBM
MISPCFEGFIYLTYYIHKYIFGDPFVLINIYSAFFKKDFSVYHLMAQLCRHFTLQK